MSLLIEIIQEGLRVEAHRPSPRVIVTANTWNLAQRSAGRRAGRLTLLGLWADGAAPCSMALLDEDAVLPQGSSRSNARMAGSSSVGRGASAGDPSSSAPCTISYGLQNRPRPCPIQRP